MKAAAEKLTGENSDGDKVIGLVLPADLNRWLPFVYQNGGSLFDADGVYAFNSDATNTAVNYFLDMVTAGNAAPATAVDSGWGGEALWKGRAAMVMEGNWVIQPMLDNAPDLNWGVSQLPKGPDGGQATMIYSVCYGVNAKSNAHPDESWKLVNFLTGEEGETLVATSGFGVLPTRASVTDMWQTTWTTKLTDMKMADLATELAAFPAGADYAVPWILPAGWNQFNDTFNASLQEAYSGNKLGEDVVSDASAVADELSKS
jgi:multiple sugar transport system substrate-binding protein